MGNLKNKVKLDLTNKLDIDLKYDKTQILENESKQKRRFLPLKIAGGIALAIVISLGVGLPLALHNEQNYTDVPSDNPTWEADSIKELYTLEQFPLVKVKNILSYYSFERKYYDVPRRIYEPSEKFLVVECEVIYDAYNNLTEGNIIYIPFSRCNEETNLIIQWLQSVDYLCVNLEVNEYAYLYNGSEIYEPGNVCEPCHINYLSTIPIVDGKVSLQTICSAIDNSYSSIKFSYWDYGNYIEDGMSLEELLDNLGMLKKYIEK